LGFFFQIFSGQASALMHRGQRPQTMRQENCGAAVEQGSQLFRERNEMPVVANHRKAGVSFTRRAPRSASLFKTWLIFVFGYSLVARKQEAEFCESFRGGGIGMWGRLFLGRRKLTGGNKINAAKKILKSQECNRNGAEWRLQELFLLEHCGGGRRNEQRRGAWDYPAVAARLLCVLNADKLFGLERLQLCVHHFIYPNRQ